MGRGMGWKRWAMVAVVLLLFAAAGCGAGGRPPAPGAHIQVVLRADGSGRVDFWVGGGVRSDRELGDLGGRLAAVLFPGRTLRATAVESGTAFPFAVRRFLGRTGGAGTPRSASRGGVWVPRLRPPGIRVTRCWSGHPGCVPRSAAVCIRPVSSTGGLATRVGRHRPVRSSCILGCCTGVWRWRCCSSRLPRR